MKLCNSSRATAVDGAGSQAAQGVTPLTLNELFRSKNPEEGWAEYARAFDWGQDIGPKVVEE